jgi:hypothetical protein
MLRLNINGKNHSITPVSKLSFDSFNRIIVQGKVSDLKDYLSLFIDIPISEMMDAEIKASSMPALYQSIFDLDIEGTIKRKPKTFTSNGGEVFIIDELRLNTFGKHYWFDLYMQLYKQEKINLYQLYVYALAIAISTGNDMKAVDVVYKDLIVRRWVEVLPAAFFLGRRFSKKKKGSIRLWITSILELKEITLRGMLTLRRLRHTEKS